MRLFTLEHGKKAYQADFAFYGTSVVVFAALLLVAAPRSRGLELALFAFLGLGSWTIVEYALHRFVLHGLQPFCRWHAEHHLRPTALICTPTILSATLITTLAFLPALLLTNLWTACALTFGVLTGYLAYSITHHATHNWRANSAWLKQRKHWHALHHHHVAQPGYYGVTSAIWDHLFGSTQPAAAFETPQANSRHDR